MVLPAHFEEQRAEVLHSAVHAHPLGLVITHGAEGLAANPLPLMLDVDATGAATLRGHVARANPLWHEAARATPWAVSDAPADYTAAMLRAIVGIEIPVASITSKWKVSQNRSAVDREGVARGLAATGSADGLAMSSLVLPTTPSERKP